MDPSIPPEQTSSAAPPPQDRSLWELARDASWLVRALTVSAGVCTLLLFGLALRLRDPSPLAIRVAHRLVYISPGTTLHDVVERYSLHPKRGSLLDVTGKVLRRSVFPGRILVDGRVRPRPATLHNGDRIVAVDGRNRTEPLTRRFVHVHSGVPDPQFHLGTAPGVDVITRGKISHKLLSRVFHPKGQLRIPDAVALTFDDGPNPIYTPEVLRTLTHMHAQASFFVIGALAAKHPELVRQELRAGMTVGDHSWSHPMDPVLSDLPRGRIRREIGKTKRLLTKLGVPKETLFRPPEGSHSGEVIPIARRLGCRVVLWSVDPRDWAAGATRRKIVRNVLSHVGPGSIVEMHDGGGDQSATVAALPAIIQGIRSKGLALARVAP
jgi:peptidoglycan/xylan/chitin deacetylase (PgdA/CDA1 family)